MIRTFVATLSLVISTLSFADPIVYVCERPAWEGVKGCGPNNTYYTYAFHLESDDLKINKGDQGYRAPGYMFQMKKGCDIEKGTRHALGYTVQEDYLTFWVTLVPTAMYSSAWSRVRLDRETLTAEMDGVEHSPFLTCRQGASEDWIVARAKPGSGGVRFPPEAFNSRKFPSERDEES